MSDAKPALLLFSSPGAFGDCLHCFVGRLDHVQLAGRFQAAPETLAAVPDCQPALVVVDLWHADGRAPALIRSIRARWPGQRCLVLADSAAQADLAQSEGAAVLLFWQLWPHKLAAKIEQLVSAAEVLPAPR